MLANKCPKCKQYIFGTYCPTCKDYISNLMIHDFNFEDTPFVDIFNPFRGKKDDRKTED